MTETSYPGLAMLLNFLFFFAFHLVSSHALPATPPNRSRLPSLSLPNQNALTITQNIQALVDILANDPSYQYSHSVMKSCELVVVAFEHGDEPHDLEHSSDINEFRDISCTFRYGGANYDERFYEFIVQNRYPHQYWDQWTLPVTVRDPPKPGSPGDIYLPFAWSEVAANMSIERADQLLKAAGHEPGEGYIGSYDQVYLRKGRAANDLAWCFHNVIGVYPDTSAQHTYKVYVNTGKVEQVVLC
ncbi:MAG: hypothetical protein LQ349_000442 [Xanthoria aureola]|nr:MAG: hypothetical protein LQ349_000442 [Xanthoria aureola]